MNSLQDLTSAENPERTIMASDFLLGPEEFVERCVASFSAGGEALSRKDRVALVEAIRAGRPRIEVMQAIRARFSPARKPQNETALSHSMQEWSSFIVVENLERYAPANEEAFIRQVYDQTLRRSPTAMELIEAAYDLKGVLTRAAFIKHMADRALDSCLSSDPMPSGVGAGFSERGKAMFNLIAPSAGGWLVAEDVFLQAAETVEGALRLHEGWILTGPKRRFPPGDWELAIDLVQPEDAKITIDVVAAAGLDVLLTFAIAGPARLVSPFRIEPWHGFLEVRLLRPGGQSGEGWLKFRRLALRQA